MIRDVVTRGFGNGTFTSTIPFTTLSGYSSAEPPAIILGGCAVAGMVYALGAQRTGLYVPGAMAAEIMLIGCQVGAVYLAGAVAAETYSPGMQRGQGRCP